jgi:DNA polymerase-3 subunit beta
MRTTNLEVFITMSVEAEDTEIGRVAIPMNTLLEISSAMNDEFLHFDISDIGKVNIQSDCGKYTIMGQPAEEFPTEPSVEEGNNIVIPSKELLNIINSTLYATSKDDLKPVLQGVLFNIDKEGLTAVATDGHRLVRLKKFEFKSGSFEGTVIIPVKFLYLLKPLLETKTSVSLKIGENYIQLNMEGIIISSRIIKERYPDYESVIPKDNDSILKIGRDELANSVRRVSIFSNKSTKQIALTLGDNKMTISTEDPENITTGKEEIECAYTGEKMTIGYNAQFLGEVLKNQASNEMKVLFKSPLTAGIFLPTEQKESEEKTTLLMPIRLND